MSQRHPREGAKALRESMERQLGRPLSRREFLRATAGAAVAVPTLSAILAACGGNPRTQVQSGFQVATPDNPVKLPVVGQPIADGLAPEKGATLQIYNWDAYMWKRVVQEFCDKYDCDFEWTTFNNMEEAVSKIQTGELKIDVFFPTYDVLGKLVNGGYLQPLNQSYIPNLEANCWEIFRNPFYDQGWQYSVPYTVYTTGISYRRDRITDDEIHSAANPRSLLWDPKYSGKVGVYDSERDTIAFALQEQGINDVNTEKASAIDTAKNRLLEMIDAVNVRTSINGSYAKLPKGEYVIHESWSGDIVAGWGYTPNADEHDYETLGYWFPEDRVGPADNDTMAIAANAEHPVLAHLFLDWMLDFKNAMDNFSWNGYQPPQSQADVDQLTKTEGLYSKIANWAAPAMYVPPWMPDAVVRQEDLTTTGLRIHELSPDGDQLWADAWQEFKAGV
jgi:spermidine/putrescine transport system substrate-binding protein